MQSKVSQHLPYPEVRSTHYYRTGEEAVCHHTLPQAITDVGRMTTYNNLNKIDIVFTIIKIKVLEAAARKLLEATSWMDW